MPRRHKLGDVATLTLLWQLAQGTADGQILALAGLAGWRGVSEPEMIQQSPLAPALQQKALKNLLGSGQLRKSGQPARYLTQGDMAAVEQKILSEVKAFHRSSPTRAGMDAEALARAVGAWIDPTVVTQAAQGLLKRGSLALQPTGLWAEPGFVPKATASPQLVAQVIAALHPHGLATPTPAVLAADHALDPRDLLAALAFAAAQGLVSRIAEDYWLPRPTAEAAAEQVIAAFAERASFSTGELKEVLGLTRKHLIPFAEWLDAERVCVRDPAGSRRIRDRAIQQWRARQGGEAALGTAEQAAMTGGPVPRDPPGELDPSGRP
jgi:selenocysteine-specific elongation factor